MLFDDADYLTVSEVNAQVQELLEETFPDVCVQGEVSNFKSQSSGHLYFTLKDADAQLRTVCFRSDARRLRFNIENGLKVLARGRLTLYGPYGQYQLVANTVEESGTGELERAFRKMKEKLEGEGLFDPAHKKPLPTYPDRIAVVTSPTGAAVRDVVSTLRRRWAAVEVLLCPVRVQGREAIPDIVAMLDRVSLMDDIDVVVLARGGGSLEDLWAFNEEAVARAAHRCPIPIISGVGHETDFTISDFVADVRAATPTMAAEMAVPLIDEVLSQIAQRTRRLGQMLSSKLEIHGGRLRELLRSYALGKVKSQIEHAMQTHDLYLERLRRSVKETIRAERGRLNELVARLEGRNARAILQRGFTLCSDYRSGKVLRSSNDAILSSDVRITFHDGDLLTEVKEKIHEQG